MSINNKESSGGSAVLGNIYAVLVGIDYPANARFGSLGYCQADVLKLQNALRPSRGLLYTEQTIRTLTSVSQPLATRRNILGALNDFADIAGPRDTLLFFFSGHGIGDSRRSESYLIPADYVKDAELLESWTDWVSVSDIVTTMRRSGALHKVAVLDACHSSSDDPWTDERWRQSGVHLLSSCEANQKSLEDKTLGGGVFTHFLCEGLAGAADYDQNGLVSLLELKMYLGGAVQDYLNGSYPDACPAMTPRISDAPVELYLSAVDSSTLPPELTTQSSALGKLAEAKSILRPQRSSNMDDDWKQSEFLHGVPTDRILMARDLLQDYLSEAQDGEALAYLGLSQWLLARRAPQQDFTDALSTYDLALQLDPGDTRVLIWKAYVLIDAGDPLGALDLLTTARAVHSGSARIWYVIARAYLAMSPERWEEARDALMVAAQLDDQYPLIHCDLGRVYRGLGEFDKAINEFNTALFLDPNSIEAYHGLGNTLTRRGRRFKSEADLQSAVVAYQRAIKIEPRVAAPHNGLGNALRELGRTEEAQAAYTRAIELIPTYALAHYNFGILLVEQGRLNEATERLQTAANLDPNNWIGWNGLGMVHEKNGAYVQAAEAYDRALRAHSSRSSRPELFYNLGHAQYRSGDCAAALPNLERAVRLRPRQARFLYDLGRCYAHLNDLEAARATLLSAVEEATSSPDTEEREYAAQASVLLGMLRET